MSFQCIVADIMPCVFNAGGLVHHVTTGVREKGLPTYTLVHASQVKGSLRCELEVLSVQQVELNAFVQALGWPETAYESLIHLKTGRTHQVGHTACTYMLSTYCLHIQFCSGRCLCKAGLMMFAVCR